MSRKDAAKTILNSGLYQKKISTQPMTSQQQQSKQEFYSTKHVHDEEEKGSSSSESSLTKYSIPDKYYQNMNMASLFSYMDKYEFSARQWMKWFEHYQKSGKDNLKLMRQVVQEGTFYAFRNLYFKGDQMIVMDKNQGKSAELLEGDDIISMDREDLMQSCLNTKFYSNQNAAQSIIESVRAQKLFKNTKVLVMEGDCLEAALLLQKNAKIEENIVRKVAVLNMASARRPGGGYKTGAGAQEENLFRRTSLAFSLEDIDKWDKTRKWKYPLDEFGGVYVPNVSVIRGSELKGYPFLEKVHKMDVVCVAAYSNPNLDPKNPNRLHSSLVDDVKKKIRLMFAMAQEHQVTTLVLSAWGSGAYKNPPSHIAALFNQVVKEYDGIFEEVVFAIYNDQNAKSAEGNVIPYEKEFKIKAIPVE